MPTVRANRFDLVWYFLLGGLFGVLLIKSEAVSWFRIQEMFRFEAFHMYGLLISAVATASLSLAILKRFGARAMTGEAITIAPKIMGGGYRYWIGGTLFGVGWALTGACPGPMFALAGSGITVYVVVVVAALAGAWVYGYLRPKLPH